MSSTPLDYALAYARRGFRVFPVYGVEKDRCACGAEACNSPGKHPHRALAPHGANSATTDEATIRSWFGAGLNLNIGMALDDQHIVVDVDTAKGGGAQWEAILANNGLQANWTDETCFQRTGSGGFHLLFRKPADARFGARIAPNVDTKHGPAQYVVVEPSRHITGGSYAWDAEQDLTQGHEIKDAPAWLLAMGSAREQVAVAAARTVLDAKTVKDYRNALAYLGNTDAVNDYHSWIEIGQALHSTGAEQAFGLWVEFSQMADPKKQATLPELKKHWASFGRKDGVTIATMFGHAKRLGYRDMRQELYDETRAVERVEQIEAFEPVEPTMPQLPCSPLFALSKHVVAYYGIPDEAALAVTLSFAGAVASRRYTRATHHHTILCAPAAVCAAANRAMTDLFLAAGLTGMLRTSRANAPSSIYATIFSSPATLYAPADLVHQARAFRRNPHGTGEHTLLVIAGAVDEDIIILESAAEAGLPAKEHRGKVEMRFPALSLFATVDEDALDPLFVRSSSIGALVGGSVWAEADGTPDVRDARVETPAWIAQKAREIRPEAQGFGGAVEQNALLIPNLATMAAPDDTTLGAALAGLTRVEKRNAERIAATLAAWDEPTVPAIAEHHLKWAVLWIAKGRAAFGERRKVASSEDGKRDVRDFVLDVVAREKSKGLLRSNLSARCKPYRNLSSEKRDELISQMVEDKELAIVRTARGAETIVLARFARVKGKEAVVLPFAAPANPASKVMAAASAEAQVKTGGDTTH